MPQENQLLLKLFFPFCYHKCSYCGQSICSYDDKVLKAYYQAMLNEMESAATEMQDMVIPAISLEGGTPLLASPEMLQTLLRFVHKTFPLTKDVQIQVQTMPGQYSRSLVQRLQNVGVNFWTIGLETANLMEHKLLSFRCLDYGRCGYPHLPYKKSRFFSALWDSWSNHAELETFLRYGFSLFSRAFDSNLTSPHSWHTIGQTLSNRGTVLLLFRSCR